MKRHNPKPPKLAPDPERRRRNNVKVPLLEAIQKSTSAIAEATRLAAELPEGDERRAILFELSGCGSRIGYARQKVLLLRCGAPQTTNGAHAHGKTAQTASIEQRDVCDAAALEGGAGQ